MIDLYDEDLPESYQSWAESIVQARDAMILVGKAMSIPLTAFAATCVFNYWIKKKIGSL